MAYVGSIDQGTSSTRFLVLDKECKVISAAQLEHEQIYPQAGWVEHRPMEIWQRVQEVIAAALRKGNLTAKDLRAVGITNQRETTVIWNKHTGEPYHNAVVWNCARTCELAEHFTHKFGKQAFVDKTGLPIASYFSALKIVWLLENVPGLREAAEKGDALFGTIDSWLLFKLSGGSTHVTDVSNASRTLLFDINTLSWDDHLLRAFNVPKQMMPQVKSSSEVYCKCASDGVLAGVPVSGILGDQQAALFGQACFSAGEAKSTYGTGCFIMMNTGTKPMKSSHGLLTTVGYKLGTSDCVYALEGAVMVSGSLIQWLRDQLKMIDSAPETEVIAKTVKDNGGVYFVPAFAGLFAPHWDETARGTICGLTAFNKKAHLIRASLEASAFQATEVLQAMEKDSKVAMKTLKVDGGMTANTLLMQFQADVANTVVSRPLLAETTALGAAFAAGLAVSYWDDISQLKAQWKEDRRWTPEIGQAERSRLNAGWSEAVSRSRGWEKSSGSNPERKICPFSFKGLWRFPRKFLLFGGGVVLGIFIGFGSGMTFGYQLRHFLGSIEFYRSIVRLVGYVFPPARKLLREDAPTQR